MIETGLVQQLLVKSLKSCINIRGYIQNGGNLNLQQEVKINLWQNYTNIYIISTLHSFF